MTGLLYLAALLGAITAVLAMNLVHSITDFIWYVPALMAVVLIVAAGVSRNDGDASSRRSQWVFGGGNGRTFPASFGVTPRDGEDDGEVRLRLDVEQPGSVGRPDVRFARTVDFRFVRALSDREGLYLATAPAKGAALSRRFLVPDGTSGGALSSAIDVDLRGGATSTADLTPLRDAAGPPR